MSLLDSDFLHLSILVSQMITFDYGMRDRNPIDAVRFYKKKNPNKPIILRKEEVCILFLHCLCVSIDEVEIRTIIKSRNNQQTNWC